MPTKTKRFRILAGFVALIVAPPWTAHGQPPPSGAHAQPVYIDAVTSEQERRELNALIRDASDVLASPLFRANLASLAAEYPVVFASPTRATLSVTGVLDILTLTAPGARQAPTAVALVGGEAYGGGDFNYTARTGTTGAYPSQPSASSMSLGRVSMYRYRRWNAASPATGDVVDHACAINTMAHEISHTIYMGPVDQAFVDTIGRTDKTAPLASYLIGSAAQCTYLQSRGRIAAADFRTCVQIFGVHNFNNLRCEAFSNGRKVELRADLPPPAPPL